MLPAFVVGRLQDGARAAAAVSDGGDQGDQLALPVAVPVRHVVPDDPDSPGLVRVQVPPAPGRPAERLPAARALLRPPFTDQALAVRRGSLPGPARTKKVATRHSSAAPVSAPARQA